MDATRRFIATPGTPRSCRCGESRQGGNSTGRDPALDSHCRAREAAPAPEAADSAYGPPSVPGRRLSGHREQRWFPWCFHSRYGGRSHRWDRARDRSRRGRQCSGTTRRHCRRPRGHVVARSSHRRVVGVYAREVRQLTLLNQRQTDARHRPGQRRGWHRATAQQQDREGEGPQQCSYTHRSSLCQREACAGSV
jgi:hypothetical protein